MYVGSQEWVPEVPGGPFWEAERRRCMMFGATGTGQDVARATWAGGAQLDFEASQVTNKPFQSVVLGLESWGTVLACGNYCLEMRRAIMGKGCKGKKSSCEEREEKNRLKQ